MAVHQYYRSKPENKGWLAKVVAYLFKSGKTIDAMIGPIQYKEIKDGPNRKSRRAQQANTRKIEYALAKENIRRWKRKLEDMTLDQFLQTNKGKALLG